MNQEESDSYLGTVNGTEELYETPNVVVEWLTLLLRIRETPGSNLGPETGYRD
jgi:hypothetical protein